MNALLRVRRGAQWTFVLSILLLVGSLFLHAQAKGAPGYPGPIARPGIPVGPAIGNLSPGGSSQTSYVCGFWPGHNVEFKVAGQSVGFGKADANGCVSITVSVGDGPTVTIATFGGSGAIFLGPTPVSYGLIPILVTGQDRYGQSVGLEQDLTIDFVSPPPPPPTVPPPPVTQPGTVPATVPVTVTTVVPGATTPVTEPPTTFVPVPPTVVGTATTLAPFSPESQSPADLQQTTTVVAAVAAVAATAAAASAAAAGAAAAAGGAAAGASGSAAAGGASGGGGAAGGSSGSGASSSSSNSGGGTREVGDDGGPQVPEGVEGGNGEGGGGGGNPGGGTREVGDDVGGDDGNAFT